MNRPTRIEALVAVLAGVLGVTGAYAAAGWTSAFFVVVIDEFVVSLTPGRVIAAAIVTLGSAGHLLHYTLSVTLSIGLLSGLAALGLWIGGRTDTVVAGAAVAGVLAFATAIGISDALLPALVTGFSIGGGVAAGRVVLWATEPQPTPNRVRRRLLAMAGGTAAHSALGGFLGSQYATTLPPRDAPALTKDEPQRLLERAQTTDLGVAGMPGAVSTIEEFYNVSINSATPVVSAADWSLTVTGAVDNLAGLTYDELRAREAEHRYVTLRCIGEELNGEALDTAVWTGIPVATLLEEATPQGEYVTVRAADGYYATYPIELLDGALLAYGMNGELLPRAHGYPARLLLPGSWGKLNVKWVTEIKVTDTKETGWWEERGWNGESPMNTVAKLWAENRLDDGRVELGGHAYAGTRGIDTVEVSIDGGESWEAAELAEPLPGEDVARQWRYVFEPQGEHEVVVRAIDGTGAAQEREQSDPFPTGATGWVRRTIES